MTSAAGARVALSASLDARLEWRRRVAQLHEVSPMNVRIPASSSLTRALSPFPLLLLVASCGAPPGGDDAAQGTEPLTSGCPSGEVRQCTWTGTRLACSCVPSTQVVTLATGVSIDQLALDANNVYFTDPGAGAVLSVPKAGGGSTTIATGQSLPEPIAADATGVYWLDAGRDLATVMRDSWAGLQTLAVRQNFASGLAIDGSFVYWASEHCIVREPIGGGTATCVVEGGGGADDTNPGTLLVDAANAYWVNGAGSAVLYGPLSGGRATEIASGQAYTTGLAIDASNVYWTTSGPGGTAGTVMKKPIQSLASPGVAPTQLLSLSGAGPSSLATDGAHLYFTTYQGSVMRLTFATGEWVTLTTASGASSVVVDATSVYFTTGTAVMKVSPK
jgi:hypothetical protein